MRTRAGGAALVAAGLAAGVGLAPDPGAAIVACALLAGVSGAWSP